MSEAKHPLLGHEEEEGISMVAMSDYQDPFVRPSPSSAKGKRRACRVHYESVFWIVFAVLTAYSVLDRFFINLFPMAINFKPLAGNCYMVGQVCANTLASKGIFIPWSVLVFDGFGRATGRLFLVVFGALFYTQTKTTENWLMEHHPSWVDIGDLRTIHNKIHYVLGVFFMSIPMVLHLLLTFLPAINGVPLTIAATRVPNKVTPFIAPNPATGMAEIFLTFDDVYRATLSLFLFLVVFPFSMSLWTRRRWFSATQWLHIAGAALFSVDMIRRSPHSQVFNTPVVFYFLLDRIAGMWFFRTGSASIIHKEILDDEYVIVFLYVAKQKRRRGIGSTYYFNMPGLEGLFEIAHPYIAFQNHSGQPMIPEWRNRDASSSEHKFYIDRSASERRAFGKQAHDAQGTFKTRQDNENDDLERLLDNPDGISQDAGDVVFFSNWNTAFFMQVHKWNRGDSSFSSRVMKRELAEHLRFWGPYTSEYNDIIALAPDLPPLVLIGTGAGAGPIADFYLYFTTNQMELMNPVSVYFSTASVGLFQFLTDLVCSKSIHNWHVSAHLTSSSDYAVDEDRSGSHEPHSSVRDMKLGRLSFMEVLSSAPSNAEVYFCGAPALQWLVQVAAKTHNLSYHPGHRFSSDGFIGCARVGPCQFTCLCSKFPLCLVY